MTFNGKLAIFWVVLFGTLWLLHRFPDSRATRLAYFWLGPTPKEGETYGHFMARRALFASGWFMQSLVVFCGLWMWVSLQPHIASTTAFMVFWGAVPLLAGTFLLAAAVYCVSSFKHRVLGPNPTFQTGEPES